MVMGRVMHCRVRAGSMDEREGTEGQGEGEGVVENESGPESGERRSPPKP